MFKLGLITTAIKSASTKSPSMLDTIELTILVDREEYMDIISHQIFENDISYLYFDKGKFVIDAYGKEDTDVIVEELNETD